MKVGKLIFCAVNLGICFLVMLLFFVNMNPQTVLWGVTLSNEKPVRQLDTIMDGSFQTNYSDWFGENFPLRSYFVKGYDQILYALGGMVNNIQPGVGRDLHGQMWLDGYLNYRVEESVLEIYKNDLETILNYSRMANKHVFYIISPNKSELYSETMPWNYRMADDVIKEKGIARVQVIHMLEELDFPYLDTLDLMRETDRLGEIRTFPFTGIHWNRYGATKFLEAYIHNLNNQGMDIPAVYSEFDYDAIPDSGDTDYYSILNVYYARKAPPYPHVRLTIPDQNRIRAKIFSVSTSYSNAIMEMFREQDMPFSEYKRWYYNQHLGHLFKMSDGVTGEIYGPPIPREEIDYSEIFDSFDAFVIEHNAGELPQAHILFIHELAEYIRQNTY